jgi:hypothetical protein
MPSVEEYGAQPPIEMLRLLVDKGGLLFFIKEFMIGKKDIGSKLKIPLFWLVLPHQEEEEINFLRGLPDISIFCVYLNQTRKLYLKYSSQ